MLIRSTTQFTTLILSAAAIVLIGGPLMLAAVGFIHARRPRVRNSAQPAQRCDWKLMLTSALLYALAYNLIFFIQELFPTAARHRVLLMELDLQGRGQGGGGSAVLDLRLVPLRGLGGFIVKSECWIPGTRRR